MNALDKLHGKASEKRMFFNQYLGQKVVRYVGLPDTFKNTSDLDVDNPIYYLELRPLADIGDEEQKMIRYIADRYNSEDSDMTTLQLHIQQSDYLRQRGFAMPFSRYEVSELIEMGWCKLKPINTK